jgi:hypothetical protein
MTPLNTFLTFGCAVLLSSAALADTTPQLMREGQLAFMRGDIETAKQNFEMVLRADPKNKVAIGYMRQILVREKGKSPGADQEKQLEALIIPQVQFRDATLGSALEYLKQQATKVSGGKTNINFVVQLPEDVVKTQTISLNVTNMPFKEVLRYVGDLANISFTFEKYAIAVKPKTAAAPAPAAAPGS